MELDKSKIITLSGIIFGIGIYSLYFSLKLFLGFLSLYGSNEAYNLLTLISISNAQQPETILYEFLILFFIGAIIGILVALFYIFYKKLKNL